LDSRPHTDGICAMVDAPSVEQTPVSLRAYPAPRQKSEAWRKLKSVTEKYGI